MEKYRMTEAVRRALDALETLELNPKYDAESGYYFFSHKTREMVLVTDNEEGGICLGAEFVMDSSYFKPILDLWMDVINKDEEGFVVKEVHPGICRVMREWLIDWESPLTVQDMEAMLDVMAEAGNSLAYNVNLLRLPDDGDYPESLAYLDI